jgi:hypothetical protein
MSAYEELLRQRARDVEEIVSAWRAELPDLDVPSDDQCQVWLRIHRGNLERILDAIIETGRKHRKAALCFDHAIRLASRIANVAKFATQGSLPDSKYFADSEAA